MLRLGSPRALLVIAPHPDDETVGAFGLMMRLRQCGVVVRVLVVTDGAASHAASPSWRGRRLIRERERETIRAVRRIGVTAGNVVFLRLPDGGLTRATARTRNRVVAAVRRLPKPALVAAPAVTDHHPDHRVVAAASVFARMAGVRRLAYPVWPAGSRLPRARRLHLTAQQRLAKRSAILSYRTQTGGFADDPGGFAMTRAQIGSFSRPAETFVEQRR